MSLQCGIVGLPNVGKSTLFNALGSAEAESANYPFCTIEPNVGIFEVPDEDLVRLKGIIGSETMIPAATEIVDIAGIVKGASKGEGLGNQFLSHIRQVDAIVHLVRCFNNDDIVHVDGSVDPARDVDTINTELLLADLQTVEKRVDKEARTAKSGDKEAKANLETLEGLRNHLDAGKPIRTFAIDDKNGPFIRSLHLLTAKPILYVANSASTDDEKPYIETLRAIANEEGAGHLVLDCSLEAEIATLPQGERAEFLAGMGLEEPGLNRFIRTAFETLGLTTYYTAGPKESRAWTIPKNTKAPQAAGVIHSDFERGFIRAECYKAADLFRLGSELKVREAGLLRQEGKEYVVQPGDVLLFKFNV